MRLWLRLGVVVVGCLAAGLALAIVLMANWLGAPRSHIETGVRYLLFSGLISLVVGVGSMLLAVRFAPSLSVKIALACLLGSATAIINVVLTPLLMFSERSDFDLLVITLLYFLMLSLAFAAIVGAVTGAQLGALRDGARRLAGGDFAARVGVRGHDEVAELARTFNRMSGQLGASFEQQHRMEGERRDLIASVSHDLRTPLAAIRAMVESINDGVVREPTEIRRYMGLIQGETEHLGRLIDDLFELSRIDSGTLELRLDAVPLAELVTETVDGLEVRARERGISLRAECDETPVLALDGARMQRVIVNLIDNALRHTPAGGQVVVRLESQDIGARLSVTDTGEGLNAEDRMHVFERFYRGERSRSRETGGAGLGLAIARGIVEAHGGTIDVESEPGHGARFVVSLRNSLPPLSAPSPRGGITMV